MSTIAAQFPGTAERHVPSLTSSFAWTLAGTAIYTACQWGMIALLAKFGSPALVGNFALGLAISAPVFMFSNLQLRGVQATETGDDNQFAEFFTLRSVCSLGALFFVFVLAAATGYRGETLAVILCIAIAKAFESWSDVVAGLLQRHERLDLAARAVSLRGVLSLAVFSAAFFATRNLAITCAALAITWAAVVWLYDMSLARSLLAAGDRFVSDQSRQLWSLAKTSVPLGIVMTLVSLNTNLPRYLLVHSLGKEQLGIFASLAYLLTAINLLILALGQAAAARMARLFALGDLRAFCRVLAKLLIFGVAIAMLVVAVALLGGHKLLLLIYGPAYASHVTLLLWLSGSAGIGAIGSFFGFAATSARSFRAQVPVLVLTIAATWLMSSILIPRRGLDGAGIALLISSCVQLLGLALITGYALQKRRQARLAQQEAVA